MTSFYSRSLFALFLACLITGCAGAHSTSRSSTRAAYNAYLRGLMLERTARLPAALDAYQLALEHDYKSPQLHVRLGAIYVKLGERDKALQEFEAALRLEPRHIDALRWIAMLETSQGKIDEAVEAYEQLLELEPESRIILSTLADLYVLQGKLSEAVGLYRRLILEHGSSSQLHFNLGVLLGRQGQFEDGIAELSRALELSPESIEIRVALGLTYELQESLDHAAAHYEGAIELDPTNPRLYHHAARAHAAALHYTKAAANYQTILDLTPHDLEAIMGLVRVWMSAQKFNLAEQLLGEKIKELDNPPELYVAVGILYRTAEHNREALRAFERAVALNEDYAQAHFYLAAQLDQLGRKDEARQRFRRTIKLDPKHADALNYLGYLDAEAGINLKEAKAFIERALILDPKNGAYMDSLGWVYYRMGRIDEAITTLERAAELLNSDPIIYDHLGDAYFKRNELERARENWERALEINADQSAVQEKLDRLVPEGITASEP